MSRHLKRLSDSLTPSKNKKDNPGNFTVENKQTGESYKTGVLNQDAVSQLKNKEGKEKGKGNDWNSSVKTQKSPMDELRDTSESKEQTGEGISLMSFLSNPFQSLSMNLSQTSASRAKEPQIFVHCVRHAQAQHNTSTISYDARKMLRDPCLTSRGLNQASRLNNTFPQTSKVTHILSSPMLRTLETTWLGFKNVIIDREIKVIAIPDLREWGNGSCNTGSTMDSIFEKIPGLKNRMETSLVPDGWVINPESGPREGHRPQRVLRIRDGLWELGRIAIEGKGEKWNGVEVRSVETGEDVHIVVVSHGGFLKALTGVTDNAMMFNAEYKTYLLNLEPSADGVQNVTMVETEESKNRLHSDPTF
ncbi:hypothetical protein PZA11_000745 [Diplocarpon coronariae]